MIESDNLENRQAIPRWLSIRKSISVGELTSFDSPTNSAANGDLVKHSIAFLDGEFREKLSFWGREQSLELAEDLLALGLVSANLTDERIFQAAAFVLSSEDASSGVKSFANSFLQGVSGFERKKLPTGEALTRREIARRKKLLNLNPRDGLRLTETALLYANLGQLDSSERLLRRALVVSPHNRYVLRAATRFLIHSRKNEEAISLLKKHAGTRTDPWLSSALMATEASMGQNPSGWKRAKVLVNSDQHSNQDISELAAQIGTLELQTGSRKAALRFLKKASANATENAVAQVEWVGRITKTFEPDAFISDITFSHEAAANSAFYHENWELALASCEEWQEIEPFSIRPAIFASYVTSISGEFLEKGMEIAEAGLLANPKDRVLLNNVSVLQAMSGHIEKARETLSKAHQADGSPESDIMLLATSGLIDFRSGQVSDAVDKYHRSIEKSLSLKNFGTAIRAYCFLAREISRFDSQLGQKIIVDIDRIIEHMNSRKSTISNELNFLRKSIEKTKSDTEVRLLDYGSEQKFGEIIPEIEKLYYFN